MLKYKKVEYETISVEEYQQKYREQQIKYMKKKAQKFGLQLVPAWVGTSKTRKGIFNIMKMPCLGLIARTILIDFRFAIWNPCKFP